MSTYPPPEAHALLAELEGFKEILVNAGAECKIQFERYGQFDDFVEGEERTAQVAVLLWAIDRVKDNFGFQEAL